MTGQDIRTNVLTSCTLKDGITGAFSRTFKENNITQKDLKKLNSFFHDFY